MKKRSLLLAGAVILFFPLCSAQQIGYPDELITRAEKSLYTETSLSAEVSEFIKVLTANCTFARAETIGGSKEGKPLEIVIMADPMVGSAEEAKKSGKPIIYIQGNIHAGEVEGKEACLSIMRDIAFGTRKDLLDDQILIFCPNYNPDGNDRLGNNRRSQEGSPELTGERASGEGFDLNREGMKQEAIEIKAIMEKVLIPWDPVLYVDLHTDNGSWHGYAVSYAPAYTSVGEVEPTRYTSEELFPWINKKIWDRSGILTFWHGYLRTREGQQSNFTAYSHQPRYMVNYMGLRNRMAILSETFAHDRFEKRILSNYMLVISILEYTNENGREMVDIVKAADEKTVNQVKQYAGKLKKGVRFSLNPEGDTIDMMIREVNILDDGEGRRRSYEATGKVLWTHDVLHRKDFLASVTSTVPRGYIYPAELTGITEKLKQHGIRYVELDKKAKTEGDVFRISEFNQAERERYPGHKNVSLEGEFISGKKTFQKGSIYVDLAQPLAWLAFYLLEPQSDDGLVFWNYFDDYLISEGVREGPVEYPVMKIFKDLE